MDTIDCMRVFALVAETGSFAEAARRRRMSRALASKAVARLEERLEVRLFTRTTRTVSLTEAGHAYHERCLGILEQLDAAESELACGQAVPSGTLRVSGPRTFGERHLAAPVVAFADLHPGIEVELDLNDRFVDLVDEGYDLAVRVGVLRDSSLIARKLMTIPVLTVASPAYVARAGLPRRPEDLKDHDCIIDTNLVHDRRWTFVDGLRRIDVPVSGRVAANSAQVVRDFALAGAGIARIPDFNLAPDLEAGRLVPVLGDVGCGAVAAYALYPQGRFLPAKTRAFVDHLAAWFSDRA